MIVAMCVLTSVSTAGKRPRRHALATCFWEGPISMKRPTTRGFDGHYFNFPEKSATYWLARFHLPGGAKLVLQGRYAHARYQSINAYSSGAPTDALSDYQTVPNRRSVNPFIPRHRRNRKRRAYRITVLDRSPPADSSQRARNTLYAHPQSSSGSPFNPPIELLYRVYEPDRGRDLTGGTGLPSATLIMAGGKTMTGTAACNAVNDSDRAIPTQTTPAAEWVAATHAPGCDPNTNPAYDPVRWERFFNLNYASLAVITDCTTAGRQARLSMPAQLTGGLYSNRDNAYIYAHLSRHFGPDVVVQAKLPTTPRTYNRARRMGSGQLRYWSLCSNESRVTTRAVDCLSDRQVPLRPGRRFVIVVSQRSDRPANATARCRVGWIDWGDRGDGAGRPDYGLLIMRDMLPAASFAQAIQNVQRPGTEAQVMGDYYPRTSYTSKSAFEARGCPAR
jgi:uncharacterized protein YmfQ (DUF2313 family)